MIICGNAFAAPRWREFAGDYRPLFGADHQAGHARIHRYPDDIGRRCVCGRTCRAACQSDTGNAGHHFWIVVVFIYYVLATLLPVDKIIGKIYPLFAIALLFMAVGILVMLYVNHPALPEVWDGLQNTNPNASTLPIFPIMFVSIACGAISGFHATQSPLMARCMTSERHGRPVFYGAMITEGIVALIWAAAATCFSTRTEWKRPMPLS